MTEETNSPPQINPTHSYPPENLPVFKPKNNLTKIAKIISGVVVIALLGTGAALATQTWDPLWNPFRPAPEKVIEKMAKKMEGVKTSHADINAEITMENESETNFKVGIKADKDSNDPDNLKSAAIMDMKLDIEGMELSFIMEMRTIGDKSYAIITTLPALLQTMGIDTSATKNQWFILDEDSMKKIFGEEYANNQQSKEKQEEITKKIEKIIENKKLYLVKEELPDEKIGEKKAYHYIVSINKEEIKKIIPDLLRVFGEESSLLFPELPSGEQEKQLNEFVDKIGELNGELWIGKKDNFIYRFKGEKFLDLLKDAKILLKIDVSFSNFNQPIKIEPPAIFKRLEEIFPPGISSSLPEAEAPTSE